MGGYYVVTNIVRLNPKIFNKGRVTFYFIANSINQVAVPSGISPIWAASFNPYLQQSSSQEVLLCIPLNQTHTIRDQEQQIPTKST